MGDRQFAGSLLKLDREIGAKAFAVTLSIRLFSLVPFGESSVMISNPDNYSDKVSGFAGHSHRSHGIPQGAVSVAAPNARLFSSSQFGFFGRGFRL